MHNSYRMGELIASVCLDGIHICGGVCDAFTMCRRSGTGKLLWLCFVRTNKYHRGIIYTVAGVRQ
jgi:hypothetical protein